MEFGLYSQPPVSNLFSLFQDAVAFHGAPKDSPNGFSMHTLIICINIYIYIYIQHGYGVYVLPTASSLESVFALRDAVAFHGTFKHKQWLWFIYIYPNYICMHVYIQHAHGVWVLPTASSLEPLFALPRRRRVPRYV